MEQAEDGTGSLLFPLRWVRPYLEWNRLSTIAGMVSRVLGRYRGVPFNWAAGWVGPSPHLPAAGDSTRLACPRYALRRRATLFGLIIGVVEEVIETSPNHVKGASIIEWVLATLWGVTFTGYFLFLWPMAFANHWLLGRAWKAEWARNDSWKAVLFVCSGVGVGGLLAALLWLGGEAGT